MASRRNRPWKKLRKCAEAVEWYAARVAEAEAAGPQSPEEKRRLAVARDSAQFFAAEAMTAVQCFRLGWPA